MQCTVGDRAAMAGGELHDHAELEVEGESRGPKGRRQATRLVLPLRARFAAAPAMTIAALERARAAATVAALPS